MLKMAEEPCFLTLEALSLRTAKWRDMVDMSTPTISVNSQTQRSPCRDNSSTTNRRVGCAIALTIRARASCRD
jgi:hypothetical protein